MEVHLGTVHTVMSYTMELKKSTNTSSSTSHHPHLCLCSDQDAGIQLDQVLYKHCLDVGGEGRHLGVQQSIQSGPGVRQVLREFPNYPGSGIEDLTDPLTLSTAHKEVGVLENGGHLPDGERSDIFDSDCDIEHLGCDKLPVTSAFEFCHLNKHSDIPEQMSCDR